MLKHRFSMKNIASTGRLNQSVLRMNRSGAKGQYCIRQRETTLFSSRMMSSTVENSITACASASTENSISTTAENSIIAAASTSASVVNLVSSFEKIAYSPLDSSFFCAQPIQNSLAGSYRDVNFVLTQLDESRPLEHRVEFLIDLANQMESSRLDCSVPPVLLNKLSPLLESLNLDNLLQVSWALRGMGFLYSDFANINLINKIVKNVYKEIEADFAIESSSIVPTEEFARKCRNFLYILRNWNTTLRQYSFARTKSIVNAALYHANRTDMIELFRVLGYLGVKFSSLSPEAQDSMVSFVSQEANIIRLSRSPKSSPTATDSLGIPGVVESLQGNSLEKLSSAEIDRVIFGFVKFKIDLPHSKFNVNDFLTILSEQLQNSLDFQVDPSVNLAYDYYVKYFQENFPEETIKFLPENFLDEKAAAVTKYVMRVFQALPYTSLSANTLSPNMKNLLFDSLSKTYPYMDGRAAVISTESLTEMGFYPLPPKLQSMLVASSGKILFAIKKPEAIPFFLSRVASLASDIVPDSQSEDFGRKLCAYLEQKFWNQTNVASSMKKRDLFSAIMLLSTFQIQWTSINPNVREIIGTNFLTLLPVMTPRDVNRINVAFRRINCNMKQLAPGPIVASPHFEKAIVAAVDSYVARNFKNGKVKGVDKNAISEEASLVDASKSKQSDTQPISPIILLDTLPILQSSWKDMSPVTRHALVKGILAFSLPSNSAASSPLSSYTTPATVKITLNRQMNKLQQIKLHCDMWDKLFALGLWKNDLARIIEKDPDLTKNALAWMYISLQEIQHTLQLLPETGQIKVEKKEENWSDEQDATNVTTGAATAQSPTFNQDLFQDLAVFYKHVLYLSAKLLEFVPVWDTDAISHIRPLVDSLFASFFAEQQIKGSNLTSVLRNLSFLKWRYDWFSHKPETRKLLEEAIFNVSISNNPVAIAAAAQSTNLSQISKRLNSLATMGFPLPVSQEAMMTVKIVLDENAEKAKSMLWSDASLKDLPKLMIAQSPLISACFAASPALAGFWEVVALRCLAENQAAQDSMTNKSPRENAPQYSSRADSRGANPRQETGKPIPRADSRSVNPRQEMGKPIPRADSRSAYPRQETADNVAPRSSLRPKYRYDLDKVRNANTSPSFESDDASSFEVYSESRKNVVSILNSLMKMAKNTWIPHGRPFVNINILEDQRKLMAKNHVFESTICNLMLMQSLEVSSWDVQRFIFGSIASEKLDDWNFAKGVDVKDENRTFSAEQWIVVLHLAKHCNWSRLSKSLRDEIFRTFLSLPAAYPSGSTASSHFTSPFEELISPMLQVLNEKNIQWTYSEIDLRHRLYGHLFKDRGSLKRILHHQQEVYPTSLFDHPNTSNDFQSNLTIQPLHITKFLPEVHGGHPTIANLPVSLSTLQITLTRTLPIIHRYQLTSLIDGLAKLNVAWKDLGRHFMNAFFENLSRQSFSPNDVHAVARLAHNFATVIYDMPWESFKMPTNDTSVGHKERTHVASQRKMLVTYNICRRLLQIMAQFPDKAFFGKDSSASSLFTCLEAFLPKEAVVQLYSEVYPPGKTRPMYLHPIIQGQLPSSVKQFAVPVPPNDRMKKVVIPPEISDHHMQSNRSELAGVSSLMATWLSTGLRTTALREELAETLARCLLTLKGKFDDKVPTTSQDRLVVKCNFAGVEYYYPISIAVLLRRSNEGKSSKDKGDASADMKEIPIAFIDIGEMVINRSFLKPSMNASFKDAAKESVNSDEVAEVSSASKGSTPPRSKTSHKGSKGSPSSVIVPAVPVDSSDALSSDVSGVEDVPPAVDIPPTYTDDDVSDVASVSTASSADADAADTLPFEPTAPAARKISLPKTYSTSNKFNRDLVNSRTYKLKSALYNKHYPGVPLYFLSIQHNQVLDAATVLAIKILQDQQNKKK